MPHRTATAENQSLRAIGFGTSHLVFFQIVPDLFVEDGKAQLMPAKEKAPMFGSMVFADVPLTVWFGQLIGEGLLKY